MPTSPSLKQAGKTRLEQTRLNNRRLLLQSVFDEGPISRADLARSTGLGRATVSEIAGKLLGEGLIVESGRGTSTGGKPPTMIELDPDGRFVVAVDLSKRPVEGALFNLRGRIVLRAAGKTVAPRERDVVDELHRVISDLIGRAAAPALGIGVGVPGALDSSGRVTAVEQLGWTGLALRDELEEVYGFPTHLAASAQAAAIAEFGRTGSDPGSGVMYVMVDDRISIGLISGGRVQSAGQRGGDLTHVSVAGSDRLCACGRRGCLGATASVASILGPDFTNMKTESRLRLAADLTPDLDEPSRMLGRVLAPIAAALHVDSIVIGGDITEWEEVAGLVHNSIELTVGWSPPVTISTLGQSAVMLGAAGIVLSAELGVVWG